MIEEVGKVFSSDSLARDGVRSNALPLWQVCWVDTFRVQNMIIVALITTM